MGFGKGLLLAVVGCGVCGLLSGCAASFSPGPEASSLGRIQGVVHGGQQPVSGAHVYLMAAAVSGSVAGGNGYGNASVSMLSGTGHSDSVGGYVLTDSNGGFSITGDYGGCAVMGASASSQVYLYATGGNSGGGTNSAIGMLAALGTCGSLSSSTNVTINEVSTVAMGYALAGFATDALHISIPAYTTGTTPDTLAATGLKNAFGNATLLADTATATAQSAVAAAAKYGAGAAPQQTVNTLANILAACVNTTDQSEGPTVLSPNCQSLLNTATSTGVAVGSVGAGTVAADTATAVVYMAQHPGSNVSTLTALVSKIPPFAPALSVAVTPHDLTLDIIYTGGGISGPRGISIDSAGDAWIVEVGSSELTEISPKGGFVLGASGFATVPQMDSLPPSIDQGGNLWVSSQYNVVYEYTVTGGLVASYDLNNDAAPFYIGQIGIDGSGNAWVGTAGTGKGVARIATNGTVTAYDCGSYCGGAGLAVDATGRIWVTGTYHLSIVSPSGVLLDGSPFTSFPLNNAMLAIDSQNRAWELDTEHAAVLEVTAASSGATTAGPYTTNVNGIVSHLALDGASNVWITVQAPPYGLIELSNTGTILSPSSGYQGQAGVNYSHIVAIDGSGDVWWTVNTPGADIDEVVEKIGAAVPVATPLVAGLSAPYMPASRP